MLPSERSPVTSASPACPAPLLICQSHAACESSCDAAVHIVVALAHTHLPAPFVSIRDILAAGHLDSNTIASALLGRLAMPDFAAFTDSLKRIFLEAKGPGGSVSSVLPAIKDVTSPLLSTKGAAAALAAASPSATLRVSRGSGAL